MYAIHNTSTMRLHKVSATLQSCEHNNAQLFNQTSMKSQTVVTYCKILKFQNVCNIIKQKWPAAIQWRKDRLKFRELSMDNALWVWCVGWHLLPSAPIGDLRVHFVQILSSTKDICESMNCAAYCGWYLLTRKLLWINDLCMFLHRWMKAKFQDLNEKAYPHHQL